MVKCTNGLNTIIVTEGAYEDVFKFEGYSIVKEEKVNKETEKESIKEEVNKFKSLEEKPIGSWSKQEVKDYASANGINLVGTKSVDEAKERIKNYILKHNK